MVALLHQKRANQSRSVSDLARLICDTAGQNLAVERFQIQCLRHRNQVVASEGANFAFYPAFLLGLGGSTELGDKLPVGAKGNETGVLLAGIAAKHLLDCACQVVVAQESKDASEIGEGFLMRLEK